MEKKRKEEKESEVQKKPNETMKRQRLRKEWEGHEVREIEERKEDRRTQKANNWEEKRAEIDQKRDRRKVAVKYKVKNRSASQEKEKQPIERQEKVTIRRDCYKIKMVKIEQT